MKLAFRIGILALVALQLGGPFLPFGVRTAMSIAAALVFVTGFPLMGRGFRIAASMFLLLGAAMLAAGGKPLSEWVRASVSMTSIICIVAVMQTFSMPIRLGAYDEAIRTWLGSRFKGKRPLFMFTTFATHLLASFLNLGAIPVIVSLFGDALKRRMPNHERFFASAATRGYVLAALWSPGAVNLYLIVQATGLSWSRVFLPGFLLAVSGMFLSYLLETGRNGMLGGKALGDIHEQTAGTAQDTSPPEQQVKEIKSEVGIKVEAAGARTDSRSRAWHIVAVAAAFVAVAALMERFSLGSSSNRVVMAGAFTSLVWMLSLVRRPGISGIIRTYWTEGLLKTADIAPFFVAMGLFSGALENSGLMDLVGPVLQHVSAILGGATVVPIGMLIILGSLVGLHPFITIVLFGKMLMLASLPIPPLTIALSLAVGGASAYMVSPFAGVIMTVSKLMGAKASDVAIRWNWRFGILFFSTGMVFAFTWGAIFG